MKKTFTLLTACILSAFMYSSFAQSIISITGTSGSSLRIIVDGRRFIANNNNSNSVVLNNVAPGQHNIQVLLQNNNVRNGQPGIYVQVYSSMIYLKPQYHFDVSINRFGKAFPDEQPINNTGYYNNDDVNWLNDTVATAPPVAQAMSDADFSQLINRVKKEPFQSDKLALAKQLITGNNINCNQVRDIIQLLIFNSDRLDFAKYAYKFTVDKNNYVGIAEMFTGNDKNSLLQYIKNFK